MCSAAPSTAGSSLYLPASMPACMRCRPLSPARWQNKGEHMRTLLFALSFVTGTIPAMAADLPVKAPPAPAPYYGLSWTGLYAGANGGYGWNVTGITDFAGFTAGNPPQGPMGGAQIRHDTQLDNL